MEGDVTACGTHSNVFGDLDFDMPDDSEHGPLVEAGTTTVTCEECLAEIGMEEA